jgi:hypothetical protein
MDREPVFQAMGAAGIFRDVATDRADQLARRIGSVVVAVGRDPSRHIEVDDAWLHGDALVGDVDIDDSIESREADQHTVRQRQGPA